MHNHLGNRNGMAELEQVIQYQESSDPCIYLTLVFNPHNEDYYI